MKTLKLSLWLVLMVGATASCGYKNSGEAKPAVAEKEQMLSPSVQDYSVLDHQNQVFSTNAFFFYKEGQSDEALVEQIAEAGKIGDLFSPTKFLPQKYNTLTQLQASIVEMIEKLPVATQKMIQLQEGKKQLDEALPKIAGGLQEIEKGLAQIDPGLDQLKAAIENLKAQLQAARSLPDSEEKNSKILALEKTIAEQEGKSADLTLKREGLIAKQSELKLQQTELGAKKAQVDQNIALLEGQSKRKLGELIALSKGLSEKAPVLKGQIEDGLSAVEMNLGRVYGMTLVQKILYALGLLNPGVQKTYPQIAADLSRIPDFLVAREFSKVVDDFASPEKVVINLGGETLDGRPARRVVDLDPEQTSSALEISIQGWKVHSSDEVGQNFSTENNTIMDAHYSKRGGVLKFTVVTPQQEKFEFKMSRNKYEHEKLDHVSYYGDIKRTDRDGNIRSGTVKLYGDKLVLKLVELQKTLELVRGLQ